MRELDVLLKVSSIASAVMVIGGFVVWIVNTISKARAGYSKPFERLDSKIDQLATDVHELNKTYTKRNAAMAHFMRRRLVGNAEHYIAQNFITVKEKEDFIEDFEQYKAMGFNHISDSMLEDVKRLSVLNKSNK